MRDQTSQHVSKIDRVSPKVRRKECSCVGADETLKEMQVVRCSWGDFDEVVPEGLQVKRNPDQ